MKHSAKKRIEEEKKIARRKSTLRWSFVAGLILLIQAIASGFLFYSAYKLGMFPTWMLSILAGVLIILLLVSTLLLISGKKENLARNFRRFTGIILAVVMTVTSVYIGNMFGTVDNTIENITVTETTAPVEEQEDVAAVMNVYVLNSSTAESLADCKDLKFGVIGNNDGPASFAAVTKLKAELNPQLKVTDYKNFNLLGIDFYHGDIQVAIINDTNLKLLKETQLFANWADYTKLIAEIKISTPELATAEANNPYGNYDKPVEIKPATSAVENIEVEPFIIYISGSDSREEYFTTERSDVNILMVVNPQTKQILLINTPRDYYIPNPRSSAGTEDKLTHLGLYGVDCSITGLENLYDCDINYYVQINFTGMEKLVDDIGGVTIDNPQSFTAEDTYWYDEGVITLNGAEALAYARERHAFAEGYNMRGQNQMRLITAMFKKVTSSPTLIMNYKTILEDLEGYILTNMEADEIDTLVRMQLEDFPEWNIQSYAVTGWGGMDTTYSAPWEELYVTYPYYSTVIQGQDLIDRVLDDEILTDEDVE
jgi:LCP family protein required for cell wall assembly